MTQTLPHLLRDFDPSTFGPDFTLGVATSAFQIEGALREGGRGRSIWDGFCEIPGKIKDGDTGDVACDHFHRFRDDVALLKWLGVDSYRFSIAWPRVIPQGRGVVNSEGLDFYDRLVDELLEAGIAPCATLYHWDLPEVLELSGGWLSRDTTDAFADYALAVSARLGDRVSTWLTHNEPWCQAFMGYEKGLFAPGHQDFAEALLCAHHLLLSHGKAVQALRTNVKGWVGIAPNFLPAYSASDSASDRAAAARLDGYFNRWFVDPIFGRGYPEDMVTLYDTKMPSFPESDLATIATPIDLLGVNYYERAIIGDDPEGGLLRIRYVKESEYPRTLDREIYPAGLGDLIRSLHKEYQPARFVITENGAAFDDALDPDGGVHDVARVAFLKAHLKEVAALRSEGIPLCAYYAWSFLDNFEWNHGYSLRYGLVHVDFESQQRTPKDSALFLRALCAQR